MSLFKKPVYDKRIKVGSYVRTKKSYLSSLNRTVNRTHVLGIVLSIEERVQFNPLVIVRRLNPKVTEFDMDRYELDASWLKLSSKNKITLETL
jgi:hypothetical protein